MLRGNALRLALFAAVAVFSHLARASAPTHLRAGHISGGAHALRLGKSIGSPTEGHLVGGAHLGDAPYLRIVPTYVAGDVRWGLEPLVSLVDRSARAVRRQYPDSVMSVGHLSREGGGELDRHASHESGRDADIGFYIRSQTGRPLYAEHFVPFRPDGTAPSWPGAYFDDAKNWALVSAIAGESSARVTYIFVASPLRARLLAYAERVGAPLSVRSRAAELMVQPHGSLPHDDHFHVRIACPAGMAACIELPTSSRARRLARAHAHTHSPLGRRGALAPLNAPAAQSTPVGRPGAGEGRQETPNVIDEGAEPPARAPHEQDPQPSEPSSAPPPAMMGDPIDDVDGPISFREPTAASPTFLLATDRVR